MDALGMKRGIDVCFCRIRGHVHRGGRIVYDERSFLRLVAALAPARATRDQKEATGEPATIHHPHGNSKRPRLSQENTRPSALTPSEKGRHCQGAASAALPQNALPIFRYAARSFASSW